VPAVSDQHEAEAHVEDTLDDLEAKGLVRYEDEAGDAPFLSVHVAAVSE